MRVRVVGTLLFMLLLPAKNLLASEFQIDDAWASKPLTEHSNSVAAFAVITNSSKAPVRIVDASSDYANRVQFHRIVHENAVVRMHSVPAMTVPSGEQLHLHPEGLHLMLSGLQNRPWVETHINIQLYLNTGETITQQFELRDLDQAGGEEHQH